MDVRVGLKRKLSIFKRIISFELWCWRRLMRVLWTARRSNQSILKEISPGCSLEGLMLKVKLQYFGHLIWRADSLEKTLILGEIESRRIGGQQRVRWLGSITDSMDMSLGKLQTVRPGMLQFMESQRVRHNWATEVNWTETICPPYLEIKALESVFTPGIIPFQVHYLHCLLPLRFQHALGLSLPESWLCGMFSKEEPKFLLCSLFLLHQPS